MAIGDVLRKAIYGDTKRTSSLWHRQIKGASITQENALELSDVLTCVRVLAESIASLPLCLYAKNEDGGYKDYEHPLYELIRWQPNSEMTSYDLRLWMMIDALLRGNGCAQIIRDGSDKIMAMHPLYSSKLGAERADDGTLVYTYPHPEDGSKIFLQQKEVLHIKTFSSGSLFSPSLVTLSENMLNGASGAENYTREFFQNGAVLSGFIEYPDEMDEETFQRLKADWSDSYTGNGNRHKTPILEGGAKFTPLNLNHTETQMLESRKYTRTQIAGLYRVPAHLMNDLEKATFSNIEHQDLGFVKHTLRPWMSNWEQRLRMTLLTEAEKSAGCYFKHTTNDLLRGDLSSRFAAYSSAIQSGIMSPNDVRRKEDEPAYDGGDTYFVNGALMPVEEKTEEVNPVAFLNVSAEEKETNEDRVSDAVEKSLQNKLDDHKDTVGDDPKKQTTLRSLKIVYNRGIGAFKTNPDSVRPSVSTPQQWAQARVNSFLYCLRNLKYRSGKHDTDLLPAAHPQSTKNASNILNELNPEEPKLTQSEYERFDYSFAADLKENYPDIWGAGGNIRGNGAYRNWTAYREGSRTEAVLDWVKEREAWSARHFEDGRQFKGGDLSPNISNVAGIVAQIKWGTVGTLGEAKMKSVINELKDKVGYKKKKERKK